MSSGGNGSNGITRRTALLGLAAGSAMLSASDLARAEDGWDKIVADAKKEGHVVLYSAFVGMAAHETLKKDFQTNYGITVEILEAAYQRFDNTTTSRYEEEL